MLYQNRVMIKETPLNPVFEQTAADARGIARAGRNALPGADGQGRRHRSSVPASPRCPQQTPPGGEDVVGRRKGHGLAGIALVL